MRRQTLVSASPLRHRAQEADVVTETEDDDELVELTALAKAPEDFELTEEDQADIAAALEAAELLAKDVDLVTALAISAEVS
jgi:hypothetical protein